MTVKLIVKQQEKERVMVPNLIPLSKFNEYFPDPTVPALRWLVFTNRDNFHRCVVRRSRRILIDVQEYFRWLGEQSGKYKDKYRT